MNKKIDNPYFCYSMKAMMYLVREGFDVLKVEDDPKNPKFKTFIFDYTPELHEAMKSYMGK